MSKPLATKHLILIHLILLLFGFRLPVRAQQFSGTIRGAIFDSAGAVVSAAQVSIVNLQTNDTHDTETSDDGAYVIPQLKPGLYRVTVKKSGFRTATVNEIKLDVGQIRTVDVTLSPGAVTETVTVTAAGGAAIETTSSTVSQTIENKRIVDLPLNSRNPFSLATLTPGVIPGPGSSPFIGGGRNATNEVTIDGVTDVNAENNVSILDLNYTPSVDAVQEFSVQTNAVSAEFGRLGGGVINLVTRGGTNQYHATLFEFLRNSALDANNFFSNRAGIKKGNFKRNQFGGNFGGPVRLPAYSGRDRTFFFVNYEGLRQNTASVQTFTVPLPEWRAGDFSNLRNAQGQPILIYNPWTTHETSPGSGRFTRDPLPGNKIDCAATNPATGRPFCNPVALKLMSFWPLPNTSPTNAFTQTDNYTAAGSAVSNNDRIDARVDQNFAAKSRMFVRFSWSKETSLPFNSFNNPASSAGGDGPTRTTTYSLSVDHSYTFSPTLVLDLRVGLNRRHVSRRPISAGFDLASLGFPANVVQIAQAFEFPRIDVDGVRSLGQATFTDLIIAPTTPTFNANATKVVSQHTFKFGMDYRKLMLNFTQLSFPSGQYSFSPLWTQADPNQSSSLAGFGTASLLIGVPSSGQISHNPIPASASSYWAFYFQDDWHISRKLTVNLGLRYDIDVPRTERFNRLEHFDLNAASPLAAGQVPANPFFDPAQLKGAMIFATPGNRRQTPTGLKNFGPRVGFAYSIADKTVIRSAYGIYYAPSALQAAGNTGSAGMQGFTSTSSMIVSNDGRIPIGAFDNPFPNGFNLPTGNALGASTFLGLGIGGGDGGVFPDYRNPYIQQWNLNIQRELPGHIVTEIAYIGSKGTRLIDGENGIVLNQLPPSRLSEGTALQTQVLNPFFGIITNPSSNLRSQMVARGRLLRPYPQYDSVTAFRVPHGSSIYHALTLKADKRFSHGVSFLGAYTWGKLIDNVSTTVNFLGQTGNKQNAYDPASDRSIGSQDIAHRFVASFVYDLPVGRGKALGANWSSPVHWIVGGWQFNGIVTFQSGLPLVITQGQNNVGLFNPSQRPTWNGQDANLSGSRDAKLKKWFETTDFSRTPAFTFGNAPRIMPNLRGDGTKNFDLSLFKNNHFHEGQWNVQFRVEFFNAFNRVQFSNPNTQADSSTSFGVVSSQSNSPRQIQLALKLLF